MTALLFFIGVFVGLTCGVIIYRVILFRVICKKKDILPGKVTRFIAGDLLPLVGYLPKNREDFIEACKIIRSSFPVITHIKPKSNIIIGDHKTMRIDKNAIVFNR